MNNKELKDFLKKKADSVEIKDYSKEILQSVHHTAAVEETPIKQSRKWLYPVCCAVVAACLLVLLIPFGLFNPTQPQELTVGKSEEIFSYELIVLGNAVSDVSETKYLVKSEYGSHINTQSSIRMLSIGNTALLSTNTVMPLSDLSESDYDKIAEDVNHYLLTSNALIAKSDIKIAYERNEEEKYSSYKYKMTVTYEDSSSYEIKYTAYYNEIEKDANELEIEGIFLLNNNEYFLQGEKSVDDDEVEMELTIYLGEDSYISVSNETASDENEYEYEYVENGVVVKSVSMQVSVDEDESKTEIEITENDQTVKYEFKYEKETIECEYKSESENVEIMIYIHNDYYLYVFEDGYTVKLNKIFQ